MLGMHPKFTLPSKLLWVAGREMYVLESLFWSELYIHTFYSCPITFTIDSSVHWRESGHEMKPEVKTI